ncbi:MAG: tetratricopeptide repeat protein [Spirochaetes bacterium]|nr:MAG: tetratricopeptide repeat protein [Spirochaetota bacterium]
MRTQAVPKEAVGVYNRALDFSCKGEYSTALKEYMRAIELFPDFIEAYNNIGEIYSRMGDRDRAISNYMRALAIKRNPKVLLNLGVEYYNRGDYAAAIKHFKESLSLDANFLEGNFYMGMAYFNLKNLPLAEKFFGAVVRIERKHLKANYLLSYIYYEWKDYHRTLQCLDNVRDIADDISFVNKYYGFCHYHLGHYEKAVEYLTTALESNPQYAKFHAYLKGLTYENKLKEVGDVDARIREMEERLMKEKPTLREYSRLSMLYIFKGEYKKAETLLLSAKGA